MKSPVGVGLIFVAAMIAVLPARANAETYTFSYCLTNNSGGTLCDSLASQLRVEVTDAGTGEVDFTFYNDVGIGSSITDIYFDASPYLASMEIVNQTAGVSFTAGSASPPDVPSGDGATPPFVLTASLLADSDPPSQPNGINAAGESLTIRFDTAYSFAEIVEALNAGPNEGDSIRIAAHVQGLPNDQSESIICCTGTGIPSPEPGSMSLFGLVAVGAAYRLRRRRFGA